jgi:hypothetical protein
VNRLVRGAGQTVPLVCPVPPLLPLVPLVRSFPSGVLPLKRHQWNIDAVIATSMEH